MLDALREILTRHYFDLGGRMGRRDFWLFVRDAIVLTAMVWLGTFLLSQTAHRLTPAMNMLFSLVTLALLPPLAGAGARRLRDVGQNGLLVWTLILALAVEQLSQLLARAPFMVPNFVYFYWTYLNLLNMFIGIALVALISFWMEPGTDEKSPLQA
jgi:uncharacterized membrane protein YhaH (DUF805 family)